MKKLTNGELYSFYSLNITINISSFTSIIIIGMMQFIGSVILACKVEWLNSNYFLKIVDIMNLTEFNNANWTTSIENNQLVFKPNGTDANSRGVILKNNY